MKKNYIFLIIVSCIQILLYGNEALALEVKLMHFTQSQLQAIGNKIWHNECAKDIDKLTWWNDGESFASLGIGHFIWYPKGLKANFTQTFPDLLVFLEKNGRKLPTWLIKKSERYCPWKTKKEFLNDFKSARMIELRSLLVSTIDLQTRFIVQRVSQALSAILKTISSDQKKQQIETQLNRLADCPTGLFAIIDYINFKGEGINDKERYKGNGWGLLQVLERMQGSQAGIVAVQEFADQAKFILTQRVKNAPKESFEDRFLAGWKKRIDGYTQELKVV
jgi:hypothetical protein